jgi:hypothetical protein
MNGSISADGLFLEKKHSDWQTGVHFIPLNRSTTKVIAIHAGGFIQDWLSFLTRQMFVYMLSKAMCETFWTQEYVFRKALSCLWSKSHSCNLPPAQWLFVPRQWCSIPKLPFCVSPLKGRDFLCLQQSFVWSPNWVVGISTTKAVKLKVSTLWTFEDLSSGMREIQPLLLYWLPRLLAL